MGSTWLPDHLAGRQEDSGPLLPHTVNPTFSKPAAKNEGIRDSELVFCLLLVFGLVIFIIPTAGCFSLDMSSCKLQSVYYL